MGLVLGLLGRSVGLKGSGAVWGCGLWCGAEGLNGLRGSVGQLGCLGLPAVVWVEVLWPLEWGRGAEWN